MRRSQPIVISSALLAKYRVDQPPPAPKIEPSRPQSVRQSTSISIESNTMDSDLEDDQYTDPVLTIVNHFSNWTTQTLLPGIDIQLNTTPPIAIHLLTEVDLPLLLLPESIPAVQFNEFLRSHEHYAARLIITLNSSRISDIIVRQLQLLVIPHQTQFVTLPDVSSLVTTLSALLSRFKPSYETRARERFAQLAQSISLADIYTTLLYNSRLQTQSIQKILQRFPSLQALSTFDLHAELELLKGAGVNLKNTQRNGIGTGNPIQEDLQPLDIESLVILQSLIDDPIVTIPHPLVNIYPSPSPNNVTYSPLGEYHESKGPDEFKVESNQSHTDRFQKAFAPFTPFTPTDSISGFSFYPPEHLPSYQQPQQQFTPAPFINPFPPTANPVNRSIHGLTPFSPPTTMRRLNNESNHSNYDFGATPSTGTTFPPLNQSILSTANDDAPQYQASAYQNDSDLGFEGHVQNRPDQFLQSFPQPNHHPYHNPRHNFQPDPTQSFYPHHQ